jgi:hypothetical protein
MDDETVNFNGTKVRVADVVIGNVIDGVSITYTRRAQLDDILGVEVENGSFVRGAPSIEVVTVDGYVSLNDLNERHELETDRGPSRLFKKVHIKTHKHDVTEIEADGDFYVNGLKLKG